MTATALDGFVAALGLSSPNEVVRSSVRPTVPLRKAVRILSDTNSVAPYRAMLGSNYLASMALSSAAALGLPLSTFSFVHVS